MASLCFASGVCVLYCLNGSLYFFSFAFIPVNYFTVCVKGMRLIVCELTLQAMSFSSLCLSFYRIFFSLQVIKAQEGWSFFILFVFFLGDVKDGLFLLIFFLLWGYYPFFPHAFLMKGGH